MVGEEWDSVVEGDVFEAVSESTGECEAASSDTPPPLTTLAVSEEDCSDAVSSVASSDVDRLLLLFSEEVDIFEEMVASSAFVAALLGKRPKTASTI